jgi:hypothetical protein
MRLCYKTYKEEKTIRQVAGWPNHFYSLMVSKLHPAPQCYFAAGSRSQPYIIRFTSPYAV